LVGYVKEISQGRFTRPIHFHNDNEINDLGQNIAKMARDIQRLLEESLRQ
jgi:signal transduction histidine kinase